MMMMLIIVIIIIVVLVIVVIDVVVVVVIIIIISPHEKLFGDNSSDPHPAMSERTFRCRPSPQPIAP